MSGTVSLDLTWHIVNFPPGIKCDHQI